MKDLNMFSTTVNRKDQHRPWKEYYSTTLHSHLLWHLDFRLSAQTPNLNKVQSYSLVVDQETLPSTQVCWLKSLNLNSEVNMY